ncbi:MAG: lytic transglycosylase [Gammaproteobacteria bacterium]|nr:MAG: lytic transglycosylase [Gammaproteobacteria bacterium]
MDRAIIALLPMLALLGVSLPALAGGADHLAKAREAETGMGGPRDYAKAYRLYCLASLEGESDAYYYLGWLTLHGRGVEADRAVAVGWFERGAKAGDTTSRNILARLRQVEPKPDSRCPTRPLGRHPDPELVARYVRLLAPEYDLDPRLVLAVIRAESNFNPRARSPKGAIGLMQLMPQTAKRFGVGDIHDPLQNLLGGMAYLKWLTTHFGGDLQLVLAGYNAGENAVAQYNGVPPYRETRGYVRRIVREYNRNDT